MGAWGTKAFDDDVARDWLADMMAAARPADLVLDALRVDSTWVAAPAGSEFLAAAEVIAALRGRPSGPLLEALRGWLDDGQRALRSLRETSVRRELEWVSDPNRSELALLWVSESFAAPDDIWLSELDELALRLDADEGPLARVSWSGTVEVPRDAEFRLAWLRELEADLGSLSAAIEALAGDDPLVARAIEERRVDALSRWITGAFGVTIRDTLPRWGRLGGVMASRELDRIFDAARSARER